MPDSYRIAGRIRDENKNPAVGFVVQAFDQVPAIYLHPDDRLGKATTGADGSFQITFVKATFKELFANDPKVYLVVREPGGKVALKTEVEVNTTGDMQFQIKLGEPEVDALDPNIYQGNLNRIATTFRGITGTVDMSRGDIQEMAEVLTRAVDSWTFYRDQLLRVTGYDGVQVPEQPRKEAHHHVTRWDRPVLPI